MSQKNQIGVSALVFTFLCGSAQAYLHSAQGRFLQRDPLGYVDGAGLYEALLSEAVATRDPNGLQTRPLVQPKRYSEEYIRQQLEAGCQGDCLKAAGEACSEARCRAEAAQLAKRYVSAWQAWADKKGNFGERFSGDVRHGWMCYQWKTILFWELQRPDGPNTFSGKCFKLNKTGQYDAVVKWDEKGRPQIDEKKSKLQHNWLIATVGDKSCVRGPCTIALDGFGDGPHAYATTIDGYKGNILGDGTAHKPGPHQEKATFVWSPPGPDGQPVLGQNGNPVSWTFKLTFNEKDWPTWGEALPR